MKKAQKIMTLVIAFVVVFGGMVVRPAQALVIDLPFAVIDPFISLNYATNNTTDSYWWVNLLTGFPDPATGFRNENVQCAGVTNPTANCAYIKREFLNSYLHLEMQPDPGMEFDPDRHLPFWFVQFSDVQDASVWEFAGFNEIGFPMVNQVQELKWFPKPGKKVILQTRVRFSPNYKSDGLGGSNGTAGIGLWNMPYTYTNEVPFGVAPTGAKAIFFTYTEGDAAWTGYNGGVYDQDFPAVAPPKHQAPMQNFDMSKWSTQTIIWEADHQGNQSVTFSISQGSKYSEHTFELDRPLPALAITNWLDSSKVEEAQGTVTAGVSPIVETQWMDFDYFTVIEI